MKEVQRDAALAYVQEVIDAAGHPGWNWETQDVVDGFEAGAKWQRQAFLSILDKWLDHAVRGMEKGNTAYHQGKVALITDLRDWIEEYEVDENDDAGGGQNL